MTTPPSRITDFLVADHRVAQENLRRAMSCEPIDTAAYALFRAGLLRHIGIEEKILLPAVRKARGDEPLERAWDLRMDHAALTALLVPSPTHQLCSEILSILEPHELKEEGPSGVYEECERYLSPEQSAELVAQAEAFPQVRVAAHYDGPAAHRTAASALAMASKLKKRGAS